MIRNLLTDIRNAIRDIANRNAFTIMLFFFVPVVIICLVIFCRCSRNSGYVAGVKAGQKMATSQTQQQDENANTTTTTKKKKVVAKDAAPDNKANDDTQNAQNTQDTQDTQDTNDQEENVIIIESEGPVVYLAESYDVPSDQDVETSGEEFATFKSRKDAEANASYTMVYGQMPGRSNTDATRLVMDKSVKKASVSYVLCYAENDVYNMNLERKERQCEVDGTQTKVSVFDTYVNMGAVSEATYTFEMEDGSKYYMTWYSNS